MAMRGFFIILMGVICLSAALPTNKREKRQSIFFEDELDSQGNPNQGIKTSSQANTEPGQTHKRDTRTPHWGPFGPPFGPFTGPSGFPFENPGKTQQNGRPNAAKFGHDRNSPNFGNPYPGFFPDFHGGLHLSDKSSGPSVSHLAKGPVDIAWERPKRQAINNGAAASNSNPIVAGAWNPNQPSWNDLGNGGSSNERGFGPNWDNWPSWFNHGQNNGGSGNNQRPNGNLAGNNGAWNGDNGNLNGGAWNGNQRPDGNNGAWPGNNQRPGGNNGAWTGNNQGPGGNNGAWTGNNQRPGGNNGAWTGNNQGPGGNNGAWTGNNQRPGGNNGAWNGNPQRPDGNNQNPWNNGGSNRPGENSGNPWNNGGSNRPGGNNGNPWNNGAWNRPGGNNGNPWWILNTQTGNQNPSNGGGNGGSVNGNNRPTNPNAAGNPGNFGNSIAQPNRPSRPTGGQNSGGINPAIPPAGARPPSTPPPDCDCPSTGEFNPVCGTDDNTYVNASRLRCARVCGRSVQVKHNGACQATTPAPNTRRFTG